MKCFISRRFICAFTFYVFALYLHAADLPQGFAELLIAAHLDPTALVITSYSIHYTKLYEDFQQQFFSFFSFVLVQQRFGLEKGWQDRVGYCFDKLTEAEGRYLLHAKDADKIRDRIIAAG